MDFCMPDMKYENEETYWNLCGKTCFVPQSNPLLLDTVLRRLFTLTDYKTMKKCRLICKNWKRVIDSMFIQQSIFDVDKYWKTLPQKCTMEIPDAIFENGNRNQGPCFTAFKFDASSLSTLALETFLGSYKMSMTHLEISKSYATVKSQNYNVDSLIGPNLRKLKLKSHTKGNKPLLVSSDKLSSVPEIDLTDCTIIVNSDAKLAPTDLKLNQFKRKLNGTLSGSFQVSEIINFRFLQKLHLEGCIEFSNGNWEPTLNLSDCLNIKSLTLISINVNLDGIIGAKDLTLMGNHYKINGVEVDEFLLNNYLNSGPKNKLVLDNRAITLDFGHPFSIQELNFRGKFINTNRNNEANVKILDIGCYCDRSIDLALIPKSLEHLNIVRGNDSIHSTENISFPNLKQLIIKYSNALSYFDNCPSLVDMVLDGCRSYYKTFNIQHLPKNIKRLVLFNICKYEFTVVIKEIYIKLDTLVIADSFRNWANVMPIFESQVFKSFHADRIVFYNTDEIGEKQLFENVDLLLQVKERLKLESVTFGPVNWESYDAFPNLRLSSIVDKIGQYYLLEGPGSKVIEETEFLKIIPFDKRQARSFVHH